MKQKRCAELHIPHHNPQTHQTTDLWSLIELASLYTVPLSAVNGLSRLTKLTTSKEQARPIRFESDNPFRIESDGQFEFESNLEALQIPRMGYIGIIYPQNQPK